MQEIEIAPRDRYLHYVHLPKDHNVISWTFSTQKRSIGFGLFKQIPKSPSTNCQDLAIDTSHLSIPNTISDLKSNKLSKKSISLSAWPSRDGSISHNCSTDDLSRSISQNRVEETFSKSNDELLSPRTPIKNGSRMSRSTSTCEFEEIIPIKNFEASKIKVKGEYRVKDPGVYILYFDNINSWNTSKRLTFFVTTYRERNKNASSLPTISGWILKKKRKKMQGWAKRWCSVKEGTLSYAKDENSVIRGSLQIPHSVVTFDYNSLFVIIDSGSSLYRFKFLNENDFQDWERILLYYLENGIETLNRLSGGLEEIPEFNVDASSLSPSFQPSITQNTTFESPKSTSSLSASKTKAIESTYNEMASIFEQLFKLVDPNIKTEDSSLDVVKVESLRENKNERGKFKPFRSKKEPNRSPEVGSSSTISLNSDSADSVRHLLSAFHKNRDAFKTHLSEEIHRQAVLESAYNDAVAELHSLKSSSKISVPNGAEASVSFQPDTEFSARRASRRRCSVYGRRQNSIVSISTIGNGDDEFFDAIEEIEIPARSSEEEMSDSGEVVCEDSDDSDTEGTVPLSPVIVPQILQEPIPKESTNIVFPGPDTICRRTKLPSPVCGEEVSFLGILRKNVGKDLATISLPISLNEPLNILQRMCEELEYCELLTRANHSIDSLERLVYVAAFAISPYSATGFRAARKPFNPLLGETFECIRPDKGFLFISEKVCHTPPIFASHAESNDYLFWQDSKPKSKFWGKSMELLAPGTTHIVLKSTSEHFTFNKAAGCMRNLVAGERYLEYSGDVIIKNHSNGEFCKITFKESSFFSSSNNEFKASVHDQTGAIIHTLEGQWNKSIVWKKGQNTQEVIWQPHPLPPHAATMYSFTQFAMELNELTPDLEGQLPSTDTRLRPDQTLFERGNVAEAEKEKARIEESQRIRRREREAQGLEYSPTWFHLSPQIDHEGNSIESWSFKGGYWEARKSQKFDNLPQLW